MIGIHQDILNMGTLHNGREEDSWKLATAEKVNFIGASFFTSKRQELETCRICYPRWIS